jgi:hypothetical protein
LNLELFRLRTRSPARTRIYIAGIRKGNIKMAKSKRVSVSATKLAETGETLEIVGAVAQIDGAM